MRWLVLSLILGSSLARAQALPDAPLPQPVPAAHCGPHWMGGCWDYRNRPLSDVAKDPHWWAFSLGLTGATAFDYTVTAVGLSRGKCMEANSDIGQHPTAATFGKDFAETHLPIIVGGLFISKVLPKRGWASWIYPAMATYGMQAHIRAGARWYTDRCM